MKRLNLFCSIVFVLLVPYLAKSQVPDISGFTPRVGSTKAQVTIEGTGFSTIPSDNHVYFGGVRGEVLSADSNSIQVTVPEGAVSNQISVSTNGKTTRSNLKFHVVNSDIGCRDGNIRGRKCFSMGNTPVAIESYDLNNDGYQDIIAANKSSSSPKVSVLIADQRGAYNSRTTYDLPTLPSDFVFADLNNDSIKDIAVISDRYDAVLSVFLGQGNGNFEHKTDISDISGNLIAAGDYNQDGNTDIAYTSKGWNDVRVLHGDGTASYQYGESNSYTFGDIQRFLSMDINKDGEPDLIATSGNKVDVLINDSSSFQSLSTYSVADGPDDLCISDVNNDSVKDIVTVHRTNQVSVLLGEGDSTSFKAFSSYNTGIEGYDIECGDLNGDNFTDLVVTGRYDQKMVSLLNNGNGKFDSEKSYYNIGDDTDILHLNDLNNDGYNDVAVNNGNDRICVLRGSKDRLFNSKQKVYTANGTSFHVTADFNNDGNPDIAVPDNSEDSIAIVLGNGDGSFQPITKIVSNDTKNMYVEDINGDGNKDIINVSQGDDIAIHPGKGDGTFMASNEVGSMALSSLSTADFDQDGNMDIVHPINSTQNSFYTILGNGNGGFGIGEHHNAGDYATNVTTGDFDNDGNPDFAGTAGSSVLMYLGNGDGTFKSRNVIGNISMPHYIISADFNNDESLDLAVISADNNLFKVFLGAGDGTFSSSETINTAYTPDKLYSTDYNGDGLLDILISSQSNYITFCKGKGNGDFKKEYYYYADQEGSGISSADINKDGISDIVISNNRALSVLYNKIGKNAGKNIPTAQLSGSQTIPEGDSAMLTLELSGAAPWSVSYVKGNSKHHINNIMTSPYQFYVAPEDSATYELISVSDSATSCYISKTATGNVDINVKSLASLGSSLQADESLTLYPNPVRNNDENLHIQIPDFAVNKNSEIRIYDMRGKLIYYDSLLFTDNKFSIKTSKLNFSSSRGLYYFVLNVNGHIYSDKILLN